jgi:glutamine synthetase
MNLVPDPTTFQILPWTGGEHKAARVVVDLKATEDWSAYPGDPRHIARTADEVVKGAGYDHVSISPELEFFLFRSIDHAVTENDIWTPLSPTGHGHIRVLPELLEDFQRPVYLSKPHSGYFQPPPNDTTESYRNEFSRTLINMGVPVKYHHHENGTTQIEVEFRAQRTCVHAADISMLYKFVSRNVAVKYGLVPTFMPKPLFADTGNGMHAHLSLWKGDRNVFFDKEDDLSLSQTARYFMGGILEHAPYMAAVTNPVVNSYRRLVLGAEAPVYCAWSPQNRSALIRVPAHTDDPHTINIEPRHPDTAANPYLVFSVLVKAGLDGVKNKREPGDPVTGNIYHFSRSKRRKLGITELPNTLGRALDLMESSDFMQRALGKEAYDRFLEVKRTEWNDYCTHVSPWEHFRYFDV